MSSERNWHLLDPVIKIRIIAGRYDLRASAEEDYGLNIFRARRWISVDTYGGGAIDFTFSVNTWAISMK